jgi:hypothetical protein
MAKGRVSLAELMGTAGKSQSTGMELSRLHEVLGEATPELPRNAIGRHRLIRALNQRFGKNFRSLPGVSNLVKQFDDELEHQGRIARMKAIKYEPPKKG